MKFYIVFVTSVFLLSTIGANKTFGEDQKIKEDFVLATLKVILSNTEVAKAVAAINQAGHEGYELKSIEFNPTSGGRNRDDQFLSNTRFVWKFNHNFIIGKTCELPVEIDHVDYEQKSAVVKVFKKICN